MKRFLSVLSCVAIFVFPAAAQLTRDAPEFEVASVKRVDPQTELPPGFQRLAMLPAEVREKMNFEGGPGSSDPGRIRYHDVSLKMLLARAYDVKHYQIEGPDWLDSERYVVEAKLRPDTTAEQLRLMLQKLLAERFQIAMRRAVKQTAVYRLLIARGGPKLKPAQDVPRYATDEERRDALKKQAQANLARGIAHQEAGSGPFRSFSMPRATMAQFAQTLAGHLDRPVRDMTQLPGEYSFSLGWTPDNGASAGVSGTPIFVAIQEQLGLKLEPANETLEQIVIDKAEKTPIEN